MFAARLQPCCNYFAAYSRSLNGPTSTLSFASGDLAVTLRLFTESVSVALTRDPEPKDSLDLLSGDAENGCVLSGDLALTLRLFTESV